MADYTIPNLETAVVGFASTVAFQYDNVGLTPVYETSELGIGNIDLSVSGDPRPAFPGRRPSQGQVFPRGTR